jgi:hypothetical protein
MPADPFIYPRLLSPTGHCIEDKTTAELDALNQPRLEESTLAAVMDYWWNLNSAEIAMYSASVSSSQSTSGTFIAMRNGTGGGVGDVINAPTFPPRDRICAYFGSDVTYNYGTSTAAYDLTDWTGFDGADFSFTFRQVYYNTTTAKYALVFLFQGSFEGGRTLLSGDDYANANTGTMVFFGQTVRSGTMDFSGVLVSVTVSNPTYYTY